MYSVSDHGYAIRANKTTHQTNALVEVDKRDPIGIDPETGRRSVYGSHGVNDASP
jgi:hypothetical protein